MRIPLLQLPAKKSRRTPQLRLVPSQERATATRPTPPKRRRWAQGDREEIERERLRFVMPEANRLTIELTARILVARGLDRPDGGKCADPEWRPAPGDGVAGGSPP
jgi:hypothetical protein